jgi:hypothetical protein
MHRTLAFGSISLLATGLAVGLAIGLAACGSAPSDSPEPSSPVAAPASPAREPASAKLDLSGSITWAGPIAGPKLFVSVRDPAKPGPPLAAKQLPPGPFPMTFTLTDADVVQMGPTPRAVPANVVLVVRLDADGDAMTKSPSEPVATLETPATAAGLAVTLTVPQ